MLAQKTFLEGNTPVKPFESINEDSFNECLQIVNTGNDWTKKGALIEEDAVE